MNCTIDGHPLPDEPDDETWVDDEFFGWVHRTSHWHTVDGRPLRRLRGARAFVEHSAADGRRQSPPAVPEDDLEP